jgi:hypothetical protein
MKRCGAVLVLGVLGTGLATGERAQTGTTATLDPVALVRRAVQHRLDAEKSHRPMRYLLLKRDGQRETTKEIIETKDGDVARLIAIDGKPLSTMSDRAELNRLDTLAAFPELQERRHKSELKDAARVDHLMSQLPESELYQMEGIVPCDAGRCYRLSFKPNPRFVPPDIESDLLRGFVGEVWIDQAQERLTRLDAHVVANIDFGFGILGKVNKGGTVVMKQTDVGGNDWELTGLKLKLTGRALMVKALNIQIDEETSHYSPVAPGIGYRDAIQMLKRPETVEPLR